MVRGPLEENKHAFKEFLLAIGRGDAAKVAALLTDDAQVTTMGSSIVSATRNRDEVVALISALNSVTKGGIELTFISFTAEEDRVSCEATGRSTLVTGGEYNNQYHMLATIREGKICSLREYIDTKYTDAALGPAMAWLQANSRA